MRKGLGLPQSPLRASCPGSPGRDGREASVTQCARQGELGEAAGQRRGLQRPDATAQAGLRAPPAVLGPRHEQRARGGSEIRFRDLLTPARKPETSAQGPFTLPRPEAGPFARAAITAGPRPAQPLLLFRISAPAKRDCEAVALT